MQKNKKHLYQWLFDRTKGKGTWDRAWLQELLKDIPPKRVVLVAGTNGKGTVSLALEKALLSAGCSVLTTISPHLADVEERIRYQGEAQFELFPNWLDWLQAEGQNPSFFESICMMFLRAARELKPDWHIVEVGIGGRYDFTNQIPHHWAVLTSLGLDHQALLGESLDSIFWQKCGVLSEHGILFHCRLSETHKALLLSELEKKQGTAIEVLPRQSRPLGKKGRVLETDGGAVDLAVFGQHMADNVSLALQIGKSLVGEEVVLSAFKDFQVPGRFSPHPRFPRVFLSGDHNPDGAKALLHLWREHFGGERPHLIVGIQPQKDSLAMLTILEGLRPLSINRTWPFEGALDPKTALEQVLERRAEKEYVVITGSLYLVGAYMKT